MVAFAPNVRLRHRAVWFAAALALACTAATAQAPSRDTASVDWQSLSPAQQAALAPLKSQWASIDGARREKWLDVASRFPSMPAAERERVQARMADWSHLTPAERGQARVRFQEAQRWSPDARQTRWEEYQSLHPDARQVLAERWKLEAAARAKAAPAPSPAKRNVLELPPPALPTPSQPASPTTVRAPAGATSTFITARPATPGPAHTGVPKIAATEAFVDPVTLLPRRGPQAAAMVAPPKPARPAK